MFFLKCEKSKIRILEHSTQLACSANLTHFVTSYDFLIRHFKKSKE